MLEKEAEHAAATEAHRRQAAHLDELRQAIAGKAHAAEVEGLDAELEHTRAEYVRRFPALEKSVHDLTSALEALEALRQPETEIAAKRARLSERADGRATDIDQYRRLPGTLPMLTPYAQQILRSYKTPIPDPERFIAWHRPTG